MSECSCSPFHRGRLEVGRLPLISLLSFSFALRSSHKLDVLLVDALIHREATELTAAPTTLLGWNLEAMCVALARVGSVRIRLKLCLSMMMGWSTCRRAHKAGYSDQNEEMCLRWNLYLLNFTATENPPLTRQCRKQHIRFKEN